MTRGGGWEEWDAEAATFDDEPDHGLRDPATRAAWRDLLTGVLPTPGRAADLGCGTGTLTLLLAEQGWQVDALDYAPAMVQRARAKTAGLASQVRVVVGDAAAPALEPGAYDAVVCRHVLWALPDPSAALGRWVELLRPDGVLVLVEGSWHTGAGLSAERCRDLVLAHRRTAEVTHLTAPVLWGGEVSDERYLLVSRA